MSLNCEAILKHHQPAAAAAARINATNKMHRSDAGKSGTGISAPCMLLATANIVSDFG